MATVALGLMIVVGVACRSGRRAGGCRTRPGTASTSTRTSPWRSRSCTSWPWARTSSTTRIAQAYWVALYVAVIVLVVVFRIGQPIAALVAPPLPRGRGRAASRPTWSRSTSPGATSSGWRCAPDSSSTGASCRRRLVAGAPVLAVGGAERQVPAHHDQEQWRRHVASSSASRPGTRVFAEGPYGAFTGARRRYARVLLIAGGIGITPLRALLEEFRAPPGTVTVLYRASSWEDVVFRDELDALAQASGATIALPGRQAPAGQPPPASARFARRSHRLVPDVRHARRLRVRTRRDERRRAPQPALARCPQQSDPCRTFRVLTSGVQSRAETRRRRARYDRPGRAAPVQLQDGDQPTSAGAAADSAAVGRHRPHTGARCPSRSDPPPRRRPDRRAAATTAATRQRRQPDRAAGRPPGTFTGHAIDTPYGTVQIALVVQTGKIVDVAGAAAAERPAAVAADQRRGRPDPAHPGAARPERQHQWRVRSELHLVRLLPVAPVRARRRCSEACPRARPPAASNTSWARPSSSTSATGERCTPRPCSRRVFDHFRDVDARFSTYKPDSEISRLGRREMPEAECSPDVA